MLLFYAKKRVKKRPVNVTGPFYGVGSGIRIHGLQRHNLAL